MFHNGYFSPSLGKTEEFSFPDGAHGSGVGGGAQEYGRTPLKLGLYEFLSLKFMLSLQQSVKYSLRFPVTSETSIPCPTDALHLPVSPGFGAAICPVTSIH